MPSLPTVHSCALVIRYVAPQGWLWNGACRGGMPFGAFKNLPACQQYTYDTKHAKCWQRTFLRSDSHLGVVSLTWFYKDSIHTNSCVEIQKIFCCLPKWNYEASFRASVRGLQLFRVGLIVPLFTHKTDTQQYCQLGRLCCRFQNLKQKQRKVSLRSLIWHTALTTAQVRKDQCSPLASVKPANHLWTAWSAGLNLDVLFTPTGSV